MSYKVNIFYPFDKGFFGKTLTTNNRAAVKLEKSSNLQLDSADDFIKHFQDSCIKRRFERSPKSDSYESKQPTKEVIDFPNIFNL